MSFISWLRDLFKAHEEYGTPVIILGLAAFTMSAEIANQYTTLLGWSHGFRENDPTARYLFSVSPILETVVVLALPVCLLLIAYAAGLKWTPATHNGRILQTSIVSIVLVVAFLLGISSAIATISDLNTLHAYGFLVQSILEIKA